MNTKRLNTRQHLFALNLFKGMSQTDAYLNAGYKVSRDIAAVNACDLVKNPQVSSFLALLTATNKAEILKTTVKDVENAVLSRDEKRGILATIARAQLSDLLDDSGQLKINKKSPAMKALKEWYHRTRVDQDGNPVTTRSAKLLDPITAIAEDNKMMGHYAPSRHEVAQATLVNIRIVRRDKHTEDLLETEQDE